MVMNRGMMLGGIAGVVFLAGLGAWGWTSGRIPLMMGDPRAVGFRNASIEVFGTACADSTLTSAAVPNVTLKDGSYDLGQYHFELMGEPKYGDVSGQTNEDTGDKAVFVGTCNQSGQTSQVLFVYGVEHSKPVRLATIDLSNGTASLVQSYSVANGTIQVKQNQGDPPQLTTISYVLLNGELKNVGGGVAPATNSPGANSDQTNPNDVDTVSLQYFYDHLSKDGEWLDHPHWGTVWRPTAVPANFRPYRNGHWENTSDDGMVWVSNEDFGDIVYHYGRWVYDPEDQWIWVPGYTWAPSWVVWRNDDNNIGWFPMPPGSYDGEGDYPDMYADWYGYREWDPGLDEAAFDGMWSFVAAADLLAANVDSVVIAPERVRGFIGRTRNWTHYGVEHGHVVDRAFEPRRFSAAFHRSLPVRAGHFHSRVPRASVGAGHAMAAREHANPSVHGIGHAGTGHSAGPGHIGTGSRSAGEFAHHGGYGRVGTGMGRTVPGFSHSGRGYAGSGIGHAESGRGFGRSQGFAKSGTGMGHTSPGGFSHSGGFARGGSGGFAHSTGGGFSRGGFSRGGGNSNGGGGFASHAGGGFERTGGNAFGGGGFANRAGGGFARGGNAGEGFGNRGSNAFSGGGNAFGGGLRNRGGGFGNVQRASAPHFSGGGGNSNGHHCGKHC